MVWCVSDGASEAVGSLGAVEELLASRTLRFPAFEPRAEPPWLPRLPSHLR